MLVCWQNAVIVKLSKDSYRPTTDWEAVPYSEQYLFQWWGSWVTWCRVEEITLQCNSPLNTPGSPENKSFDYDTSGLTADYAYCSEYLPLVKFLQTKHSFSKYLRKISLSPEPVYAKALPQWQPACSFLIFLCCAILQEAKKPSFPNLLLILLTYQKGLENLCKQEADWCPLWLVPPENYFWWSEKESCFVICKMNCSGVCPGRNKTEMKSDLHMIVIEWVCQSVAGLLRPPETYY